MVSPTPEDSDATHLLILLLYNEDDVGGCGELADAGDELAAERLIQLVYEHGDVGGLRELADAGYELELSG